MISKEKTICSLLCGSYNTEYREGTRATRVVCLEVDFEMTQQWLDWTQKRGGRICQVRRINLMRKKRRNGPDVVGRDEHRVLILIGGDAMRPPKGGTYPSLLGSDFYFASRLCTVLCKRNDLKAILYEV